MTMNTTMCELVHGLTDEQACERITELQGENVECLKLCRQMHELWKAWDEKGIAPLHVTVEVFGDRIEELEVRL